MTVSSAPIGSTGQSLDGFAVNANVPAAFRESVVITDPNDPSGIAPVVSTQPLTGYALPVWIQGTPNFSSTVNITSTVNVTTSLFGSISSFAVNPIPGTSQVFGTVSTQIVSSIPLLVSQTATSNPWIVSSAPIAIVGTTQVNIVSSIALGGGTQYLNGATTSGPTGNIILFASGVSSQTMQVVNNSSNALPVYLASSIAQQTTGQISTFPIGTTQVNIVSSIPLGGGTQYLSGNTTSTPTGNIIMFATGTSSQTMQAVNNSSNALPVYLASSIAQQTTGQISTFPIGTTQVNIVSSIALGGGTQYVNNSATTQATGNMNMWASGAGNSTVVMVSSSQPFPVNIVSTITQTVQGTVSTFPTGVASVAAIPVTGGGLIPFIKIGVTTASVQIKSGAGKLHDIAFTNNATSTRWLKFYNASSAAVGTTAPFMVFGMPGNTTGAQPIAGWIASAMGYGFSTNIFVAATASSATSTDTSSPASGDIVLNVGYI